MGIYKVILYASEATGSVAGWQIELSYSGTKTPSQANDPDQDVHCSSDTQTTTGFDTTEVVCDANLGATTVTVSPDSGSDPLAEIVVVGRAWDSYPCDKGYYSSDGTHGIGAADCQECDDGYYQTADFSSSSTPTSCSQCEQTLAKYTDSLDLKKSGCSQCPLPQEITTDNLGTCVDCPAGTEYVVTGSGGCTYESAVRTTVTAVSASLTDQCTSISCVDCPVGTYNTAGSGNYCLMCQAGHIPSVDKDACEPCQAGTKSNSDQSACENCGAGLSSTEGSADCTPCENNEVSAAGPYPCSTCPAGQKPNVDQSACEDCGAGLFSTAASAECSQCLDNEISAPRSETCSTCSAGQKPNSDQSACEDCVAGFYSEAASADCTQCSGITFAADPASPSCTACPEGEVPNSARTACEPCPGGQIRTVDQDSCTPCPAPLEYSNDDRTQCLACSEGAVVNGEGTGCTDCPAGQYRDADLTTCRECAAGTYSDVAGSATCTPCNLGEEAIADKTGCTPCEPGQYRDADVTTCQDCAAGTYSDEAGSETCTPCSPGYFGESTGMTACDACPAGKYRAAQQDATSCVACPDGTVTTTTGQYICTNCQPGQASNELKTVCEDCAVGKYKKASGQGSCKDCPLNTYANQVKTRECTPCGKHEFADETGSTACKSCPSERTMDAIEEQLSGNTVAIEKCKSDLGDGCFARELETIYGTFDVQWMAVGGQQEFECAYDDDGKKAVVLCVKVEDTTDLKQNFECIKTEKSGQISNLADDNNLSQEEKANQLEELTNVEETNVENGVGDVTAVNDVVSSMTEDGEQISEAATASILGAVSNVVSSEIAVTEDQEEAAVEAQTEMMNEMLKVADSTTVKNEPITSPSVAVVSLEDDKTTPDDGDDDAPSTVSFSLPSSSSSDLQNLEMGESESENTVLMIETQDGGKQKKLDMSIVLVTELTMTPDRDVQKTPTVSAGEESEAVNEILKSVEEDLSKDGGGARKTYLNSLITEVKVKDAPEDFNLNLFMRPTIDIGGTNESLKTNEKGQRVQMRYECSEYNLKTNKWEASCETVYDMDSPSSGVLCFCNHNTSFAVLMSAYEIDRGYAEAQSHLTHVLLSLSTIGLIFTLALLVPAKTLRSTRSAKINICFTLSLLLASLLFLLQDAFISADNTGIIKLRSVGCAVYAMLQHYLWLVVFCWMVIEGFLMYLSLVQVFGSHISKYMLKFNLAAWCIPLPFPFIGYFCFTKVRTVGKVQITEHGYIADTMCFIKPETIPFYTLFLAPLCLVIFVNLVFFVLVARVIKSSKSSGNISDQEQLLRQLKAAVGVMVLLGTGWFFGIFMSIPTPEMQLAMQYMFILLNSSQGCFVFLFYIVLNDQVKAHWLVKLGLREEKKTGTSSAAATKTVTFSNTKQTVVSSSAGGAAHTDNVYENASLVTGEEDHTYSTAEYANSDKNATAKCEFPAKSDDNARI